MKAFLPMSLPSMAQGASRLSTCAHRGVVDVSGDQRVCGADLQLGGDEWSDHRPVKVLFREQAIRRHHLLESALLTAPVHRKAPKPRYGANYHTRQGARPLDHNSLR
jgi:hypothetical protein